MPVLAGEAFTWYGDNHNVGVAAGYSLLIMLFSLVNTGIYLRAFAAAGRAGEDGLRKG